MQRWLSNNPFAPPSSKSAAVFLKSGSTSNSRSNDFRLRLSMFASRVFVF